MWAIWKTINDFIYRGIPLTPLKIIKVAGSKIMSKLEIVENVESLGMRNRDIPSHFFFTRINTLSLKQIRPFQNHTVKMLMIVQFFFFKCFSLRRLKEKITALVLKELKRGRSSMP